MIIAHSAGLMSTFPNLKLTSSTAPMLVGLGSIAGGYLGGVMANHLSPRKCLGTSLFGLAAALAGLLLPLPGLVLLLLMACGLCYGVLISVIPNRAKVLWQRSFCGCLWPSLHSMGHGGTARAAPWRVGI